jgi:hypothetical protein
MSTDARQGSISITWTANGIGEVTLDGVVFARVEWSERRQRWCCEDSEGQCLKHVGSIKGMAASKDEAAARAIAMVRDGRMPDPKTARAEHRERQKLREERLRVAREKRRQQPAEIQKREAKAEQLRRWGDASMKEWKARVEEDNAPPLYEALADAFDFADPELWKSNSFAALRPRLALHVRRVIAGLEKDLAWESVAVPSRLCSMRQRSNGRRPQPSGSPRTAFWRSCPPADAETPASGARLTIPRMRAPADCLASGAACSPPAQPAGRWRDCRHRRSSDWEHRSRCCSTPRPSERQRRSNRPDIQSSR